MTTRPFRLKALSVPEHDEQVALFRWADVVGRTDPRLRLLNASQNGMRASSIATAARAKAAGMRSGFPDVFLPVPTAGLSGLFIELKRRDGVPSDVSATQRWWLAELRGQGYAAEVCYGWNHAVEIIENYLGAE